MQRFHSADDLNASIMRLAEIEPRFAGLLTLRGPPPLRQAKPGLVSLLRIVTDQLISLRAGHAIWARVEASLGSLAPEDILARNEKELRSLGLSGAKARTFIAAAQAFSEGRFNGEEYMSVDTLLARLTDIPGVGPWTANIYLLTAHRSADAWPAADLALQIAAADLFGLSVRPSARDLERLAEGWRPHRSAAALLLWGHYRAMKELPPA